MASNGDKWHQMCASLFCELSCNFQSVAFSTSTIHVHDVKCEASWRQERARETRHKFVAPFYLPLLCVGVRVTCAYTPFYQTSGRNTLKYGNYNKFKTLNTILNAITTTRTHIHHTLTGHSPQTNPVICGWFAGKWPAKYGVLWFFATLYARGKRTGRCIHENTNTKKHTRT